MLKLEAEGIVEPGRGIRVGELVVQPLGPVAVVGEKDDVVGVWLGLPCPGTMRLILNPVSPI